VSKAKKSTDVLCREILQKIVERANAGVVVKFSEDWGGNSLKLYLDDMHTHVGPIVEMPEPFEQLVKELHSVLHGGPGLSFVGPPKTEGK
jgi:hypothetical protein